MRNATFRESVLILIAAFILLSLFGCAGTPTGAAFDWRDVDGHDPDYNAAGGYRDACGELPPMVGSDC